MAIRYVRADITTLKVDAIVNSANPFPVIGGGTDSSIYKAAGKDKLLAERKKIGSIDVGDARAIFVKQSFIPSGQTGQAEKTMNLNF